MFSPPAVDVKNGLVYGTFGQLYTQPASVAACHAAHGGVSESCEQPGALFPSLVAFDMQNREPPGSYPGLGAAPWQRAGGHQPAAGAGGDQGGIQWGTAYDGDRLYAAITNQHNSPYPLTQNGVTSGPFVTGGSWAALDPDTGQILWQTGDPAGAYDLAPLTTANGVVYASSM